MKKTTIIVSVSLLALSVLTLLMFMNMNQLPSPLYGGDVFYHYGVVKHIYDGNSPFENSQFKGEGAHYPWLMHLMVAYLAKITHNPLKTAIFFPVLMTLLSGIISYNLGRKLFGNFSLSLLFAVLFSAGFLVPMLTASSFTILIIFPLFILADYFYSDTNKKAVLVGIVLGMVGLSHIAGLVAAIMFTLLHSAYKLVTKQSSFKKEVARLFIIFLIGGAISLLYWWQPIFRYHLHTPNRWSAYVAAGEQIGILDVFSKIKLLFFNTSNWALLLLSSLSGVGFLVCIFKAIKSQEDRNLAILPILLFITGIVGFAHPIVTLPLFNVSIGSYGFDVVFLLMTPLFAMCLFYFLLPQDTSKKSRYFGTFLLAGLFVFSMVHHTYAAFDKDIWTNAGRADSPFMNDLINATTILDKSEPGTILPLSEESGFAINAISGKKVVFARRTHTSPFVDMNKRSADAAVMLFGNNSEVKKKLFEEYDVKYFYLDQESYLETTNCFSYWENITGDKSFSCLRTSKDWTSYLEENGITWKMVNARLDPASPVAPRFDIVIVKPNSMTLNVTPLYMSDGVQIGRVNNG